MNCCVLSSDAPQPEFFLEKIVKARKKHICGECWQVINIGDKYEHVSGKWDGDMRTCKTCGDCREIRNAFNCGDGWIYEQVWDDIYNSFCEEDFCFAKKILNLSESAREKIGKKIERWQKIVDDRKYENGED